MAWPREFTRLYPLKEVNAEGVDSLKRALLCHYSAQGRSLPEELSLETLNTMLGGMEDARREVTIRYYGLATGCAMAPSEIAEVIGGSISRAKTSVDAALQRIWRLFRVRVARRQWEAATSHEERLGVSIDLLDLKTRTYNALMREDIQTIGQLTAKPRKDLEDIRQFGQGSRYEIQSALKPLGLSLRLS